MEERRRKGRGARKEGKLMNTNCGINFTWYISSLVLLWFHSHLSPSFFPFFIIIVILFRLLFFYKEMGGQFGPFTSRQEEDEWWRRSFFGSIAFSPFLVCISSFNTYYSAAFNVVLILCNFVLQPIHVPTWLEWMFFLFCSLSFLFFTASFIHFLLDSIHQKIKSLLRVQLHSFSPFHVSVL